MDTVERIFELADQRFKEQKDFAAAIAVDANLPSRWKNRKSKSYQKYLPQIADVLGTTVDYLVNGSPAVTAEDLLKEEETILRMIRERPDMRALFSLTSKATAEDIQKATQIMRITLGLPPEEPHE